MYLREAKPRVIHQGGYTSGRLYQGIYTREAILQEAIPGFIPQGVHHGGYPSGVYPGCTMVGILQVCTMGVPQGVNQ